MSTEEDILIQDFIKNKLSEKERNELLQKMEHDESFREKVNFEKQLYLNLNDNEWSLSKDKNHSEVKEYEKLLKDESTLALKNTLHNVNSEYQKTQNKSSKFWLLYASIAVVIFLIGVFIFSPNKTIPTNELYVNYLKLSDLPSLVDRGKTDQILSTEAQKLFEAKQYDKTLDILINNGFEDVQKNKATIYLYIGISQMELNQFSKAEKTFDKLIHSKLMDAPKGTWYKALLYIKQNKIERAKEILSEIAKTPNNYKSKEASELLNLL